MKKYTTFQQIKILNSCKNAMELLETKELIEELQPISRLTQLVYDRMMCFFLVSNKIVA